MAWEQDLLAYIGAPATMDNLQALDLWAASEGMPASANNWLATTWRTLDSTNYNDVGVQAYPDEVTGVESIGDTLLHSDPAYRYASIVAALQHDSGITDIYKVINASSWCQHCDGGHYPSQLYSWVVSHGGFILDIVTGGSPSTAPGSADAPDVFVAWDNWHRFVSQDGPDQGTGLSWLGAGFDALH